MCIFSYLVTTGDSLAFFAESCKMSKVWKVGSRWDGNGDANMSILNIFRRNSYVFVGDVERFKYDVKRGDYIAIADGYNVVAVSMVLDEVEPLERLIEEKKLRFRPKTDRADFSRPEEFKGAFYGVRVNLVDLPENEQFQYHKRGTFFAANKYSRKIKDLYDTYSNKAHFDISSGTYRLKNLSGKTTTIEDYSKKQLLDGKTYYVVPVYQREYSWDEEQITRFIHDIFDGYWSVNEEGTEVQEIKKDPLFIGTMQLSQKKVLSYDEYEQDIIDGQQRITTLFCLFKYITLKYPEAMPDDSFDWLETRVNNGKEQGFLSEFKNLSALEEMSERSENKYIRNCAIIANCFNGEVGTEFDINDFLEYVLSSTYFVVVETVAGLSKTIQIFNTINTGGLDLNGDDLFKVRFYEYLRDCLNESDDAFNRIGEIYKRIKDINAEWREQGHDCDILSMSDVRTAYKDYLISCYELPNALYPKATDTFYDYLFDVLLGIQPHKEMGDAQKIRKTVRLKLEDLENVVDKVAKWKKSHPDSYEQLIACQLIVKSRYGRYHRIAWLLMLFDFKISEVYEILLPLSKVYFCYSLLYSRVVNEVRTFTYSLQKLIGKRSSNKSEIVDFINKRLNSDSCKNNVAATIKKQIAWNRTWKDLVCCLSVYLYEVDKHTGIEEIARFISDNNYDIEHIHATEDNTVAVPDDLQHGIGNLTLLECSINRSVGNKPFEEKKKAGYGVSRYQYIRDLCKLPKWGDEEIKVRLDEQCEAILNFLGFLS